VTLIYASVGATRHDSEVFANNSRGQSRVSPYQIREKRRGIIITKTIHDWAGNTDDDAREFLSRHDPPSRSLELASPDLRTQSGQATRGLGRLTDREDDGHVLEVVFLLKTISRRRTVASGRRRRHCCAAVNNR